MITDTSDKLSIASDQLVFTAGGAGNDPKLYTAAALTRKAGRTALFKATITNATTQNSISVGWSETGGLSDQVAAMVFLAGGVTEFIDSDNLTALTLPWAQDTAYRAAMVLRATGAFYFIKGGVYTDWTLAFVGVAGSGDLVGGGGASGADDAATVDYLRVIDLHAPFDSDYGIAVVHTAAVDGRGLRGKRQRDGKSYPDGSDAAVESGRTEIQKERGRLLGIVAEQFRRTGSGKVCRGRDTGIADGGGIRRHFGRTNGDDLGASERRVDGLFHAERIDDDPAGKHTGPTAISRRTAESARLRLAGRWGTWMPSHARTVCTTF